MAYLDARRLRIIPIFLSHLAWKDNGKDLDSTIISLQLPSSKIVPDSLDWSLTQTTQLTSQIGVGSSNNSGSGTPAKRQRLAPDKKSLLELIKENSGTLQAVPW